MIFNDLLQEFHARRRQLNLYEFLTLFPEFDYILEGMNLGKLSFLLPELVDEYGEETPFSFKLNADSQEQNINVHVQRGNRVTFKQD